MVSKLKQKIKSIEKGWGENSTFFSVDEKVSEILKVDKIREEFKDIGEGYYNNLSLMVYRGYKKGKMVFEIAANTDITLTFLADEIITFTE